MQEVLQDRGTAAGCQPGMPPHMHSMDSSSLVRQAAGKNFRKRSCIAAPVISVQLVVLPLLAQVMTICKILEGILPKEKATGKQPPPDKKLLEYHFVFACVWAFGGCMLVDKVTSLKQAAGSYSCWHCHSCLQGAWPTCHAVKQCLQQAACKNWLRQQLQQSLCSRAQCGHV